MIHISLRSSGSVISRMIEAETEKLQKMDWVKIYMEKEDYETMVQADGHLAEKLSRLSDNVKFIVMEDGKMRKLYHRNAGRDHRYECRYPA